VPTHRLLVRLVGAAVSSVMLMGQPPEVAVFG
jgi:hypothetical protein